MLAASMPNSSISVSPGQLAGLRERHNRSPAALARRAWRGRPADPPWSRPALLVVALAAAALTLWALDRSGYANTYYSSAVYAQSRSWPAFFYNALDPSQLTSIDKTPLSMWMMALSARIFGFSSFSMLLPNALCGVASVLVLHNTVRRTLGHRAAIVAAGLLALTPVTVMVSRFNNPDALLVLLLVCSAWALVRALETGRTRDLLLCGVLVGLAFNTKMLQAYLIVPALALTLLLAGRGSVRRRVAQLTAAGAAMFAVSAVWVTVVMLVPAGSRPFAGDTTTNSWWDLIFGANGLSRVGSSSGGGPAGGPGGAGPGQGFGGSQGVGRLFNAEVGGQIAWLLPVAAVGLLVGLWITRRAPREDRARASYVLWGLWLLTHVVIFSFSLNLFHPYYTSALAPAVAVLAGGGLVALWERAARSRIAALALAVSLAVGCATSIVLLDRTPSFVPWLRWLIVAATAVAIAGTLTRGFGLGLRRPAVASAIVVAGLAALVAGPAAYSVATTGTSLSGGNPTAGPASAQSDFGPGPGAGPRLGAGVAPPGAAAGALFGPPPGALSARGLPGGGGGPAGAGGQAADAKLVSYLKAHRGTARYIVAATGSQTAAPIMLAASEPVVTMGGFMGSDPSPSLPQLQSLISSGQLRYVLLDAGGGPRGELDGNTARDSWVTANCSTVSYAGSASSSTLYDCATAR
jgi:4-amino-4-deoxy-L-arabinose transferase-like glycosyltransferase